MNSCAVVPTMPLYTVTSLQLNFLLNELTWLEVEQPYMKLFSLAKLSSPLSHRKGCKKAMLVFSVPLSALKIVAVPMHV